MAEPQKKTAPRKPGKRRPGVEKGDEVYFKAGDQHTHGRVVAHGSHGCHIDHAGGRSKVYWEDILGHKSRSAKSAEIVDQGDDGFLVKDDKGRHRFIAGEPPKVTREDTPSDHAHLSELVQRGTPMHKSLDRLELLKAHVSAYTKKDGTFVAAHEDKRIQYHGTRHKVAYINERSKAGFVTGAEGVYSIHDHEGRPKIRWSPESHLSRQKEFEIIGESVDNLVDQADARMRRSNATTKTLAKYDQIPRTWTGDAKKAAKALIDAGYSLDFSNSTQSKSKYITVNGIVKVRLSDHELPANYDAPDVDYRYGGEVSDLVAAVKENLGGTMQKSVGETPILFFKSGPLANRPGLSKKVITDRTGKQTTRWVRTNPDQPANDNGAKKDPDPNDKRGAAHGYGTHDIQMGSRVKFSAGEHKGEGEVTALGNDGVHVKDSTGREHQIHHHEITHFKPETGRQKTEVKNSVLGKQDPIAAESFAASDYAKSHDQADVSVESVLANFPPDTADRINAAQERLKVIEQTVDQFKRDGKWDAQREVLHHAIVAKFLSPERVAAATPNPGEAPKFVILGGRGGSGKSALTKSKEDGGTGAVDESKFIVLDADKIKDEIPEYEGWNAHSVHEESGEIFDHITDIAQRLGLNICHDATMKTPKKAVALVQRFNDAGYDTEAHYMHLPRQEAAKRAVDRFLRGGEKGRYVPVDVVLSNTLNEQSFDSIKGLVKKWSFHDNNVPEKTPPILISKSGDAEKHANENIKPTEDAPNLHKSESSPIIMLFRRKS